MGQSSSFWKENWQRSWRLFRSAQLLLGLWLILPFIFLSVVFGIRACEPLVRPAQFARTSRTLTFTNTLGIKTTLYVSYPKEISSDPAMLSNQVVSLQARQQGSLDETSIISVESSDSDGLVFIDEQERPLSQPWRWRVSTDTLTSTDQTFFYLRPASVSALKRREFDLQFQVRGQSSGIQQLSSDSQPVSITVEPAWLTWLFRVSKSEGGLATAVVTILGGLVGFGVQQWNKLTEETNERRQEREEAWAEIEDLRNLLKDKQFDEALGRYRELGKKLQFPWQDESIQDKLKAVWRETAPWELQKWVSLSMPDQEADE